MKKNKLIFLVLFLAYSSIYIARLNLTIASPVLKENAILNSAQIGILGGIFAVVFSVGRLINGYLSDLIAPYKMICIGLALSALGNILFSLFPPFYGLMFLWGINAFSQSMLWSSILCVVSSIYDKSKAGKMASYMVTSVAAGNILGIIVSTVIITNLNVGFAFVIPGAIMLVFSFLSFLSVRSVPYSKPDKKEHISLFKLFTDKKIMPVMIPSFCHGVMKENVGVWMSLYFVEKFNIDLAKSALFILFIPFIGFIGRISYPLMYKLCKNNEHMVSVFGFSVCILSSIVICFSNQPVLSAACLSLIYAAASVINTSVLSIFPLRFVKSNNVASVSGLLDFMCYLGAGIGSFVFGIIIDGFGYEPMYITFAVISAVSILVLFNIIGNFKLFSRKNA